jgi:IS30 family transposase
LRLEQGRAVLSAESIYRFLYAQIRRTGDTDWRNYLPRRKYKRGYRRPKKSHSPMRLIEHRIPLAERPAEVLTRTSSGHWEADLMQFRRPAGAVLLVAQERRSRLLIVSRQSSKAATPIAERLERHFGLLPEPLRQSVTFDNGAEFSHHHRLQTSLNMKTYFCDSHSPWQKGGIENAIGRLRRVLPRKIDPQSLTPSHIHRLTQQYNHTPRKCLGFKTPAECFTSQLMHFKWESTSSLRSEWQVVVVGGGEQATTKAKCGGRRSQGPSATFSKRGDCCVWVGVIVISLYWIVL